VSKCHASEDSDAVFHAVCGQDTGGGVVHVWSKINPLVMEFAHDVIYFVVNFSVHSQVRSAEVLPRNDPFLWHWWVLHLVLMEVLQALNYSIDFLGFGINLVGPLFLGSSSVNFVLLSIFIHNLLLFWREITLVFFLVWMIEVLLLQNIDDVVSWNDADQSSLLVYNWESMMVVFFIVKYFLDVLDGLDWSEHINLSFHDVVGFQVFAAFSDTMVGKNWHLFGSYESLICTSCELVGNSISAESAPEHWQNQFPILEDFKQNDTYRVLQSDVSTNNTAASEAHQFTFHDIVNFQPNVVVVGQNCESNISVADTHDDTWREQSCWEVSSIGWQEEEVVEGNE